MWSRADAALVERSGVIAARLGLSTVFVTSGVELAMNPGQRRVGLVQESGLPRAELLVRGAGMLMTVAGVVTALDRRSRVAPAVLALVLAVITPVGHPLWRPAEPEERRQHRIHILKNLGLFGALIALATRHHQE